MNDWNYVLATSIGTSHIQTDHPCQDNARCETIKDVKGDTVILAVVSDGAGSAQYSQIGSEYACAIFLERAKEYLANNDLSSINRDIAFSWLTHIKDKIASEAANEARKSRDYACTIVAALVGETHAVFIQLGDGAMVVSDTKEGEWSWIFWPQKGEFANTTFFLTDENIENNFEYEITQSSIFDFAVFTDGIESLVLDYANRSAFAPFFDKMFPAVRESNNYGYDRNLSKALESYLSSPAICERTDDDKSLILASKRTPSVSSE